MATPSTAGGVLSEAISGLMRVNNPNTICLRAYVAIGASGAATVSQNGGGVGPITVVKNTTGVYDVTFPVFAAATTSLFGINAHSIFSAAATVARAYVKAQAPTSGTAQIVTYLNTAGTPVEPASGDSFILEIVGTLAGQY